MSKWLIYVLTICEAAVLIIPWLVYVIRKPKGVETKILATYVVIGFTANLLAALVVLFYNSLQEPYNNNNIFYNTHSVLRVILLGYYLMKVCPSKYARIFKLGMAAYLVFCIVNFTFFESFLLLSAILFPVESFVLLLFSLLYLFHAILDESEINWTKEPSFYVVTGIALYETITFFAFLFYSTAAHTDYGFTWIILIIYSLSFIALCILIAVSMYFYSRKQYKIP